MSVYSCFDINAVRTPIAYICSTTRTVFSKSIGNNVNHVTGICIPGNAYTKIGFSPYSHLTVGSYGICGLGFSRSCNLCVEGTAYTCYNSCYSGILDLMICNRVSGGIMVQDKGVTITTPQGEEVLFGLCTVT